MTLKLLSEMTMEELRTSMTDAVYESWRPESIFTALKIFDELARRHADLRAKLDEALCRMDRARDILTKGTTTLECNWGVLDTSDLRPPKEEEK